MTRLYDGIQQAALAQRQTENRIGAAADRQRTAVAQRQTECGIGAVAYSRRCFCDGRQPENRIGAVAGLTERTAVAKAVQQAVLVRRQTASV